MVSERRIYSVRQESTSTQSFGSALAALHRRSLLVRLLVISVLLYGLSSTLGSTILAYTSQVANQKESIASPEMLSPVWYSWFFLTGGSLTAAIFDSSRFVYLCRLSSDGRLKAICALIVAILFINAAADHFVSNVTTKELTISICSFIIGALLTSIRNENSYHMGLNNLLSFGISATCSADAPRGVGSSLFSALAAEFPALKDNYVGAEDPLNGKSFAAELRKMGYEKPIYLASNGDFNETELRPDLNGVIGKEVPDPETIQTWIG